MSVSRELAKIYKECRYLYRYGYKRLSTRIQVDSPPTFIVSSPHSGSSILLSILGAHSRIYAIPRETNIALKYEKQKFLKQLEKFDRMAVGDGKYRWIEKTPKHIRCIDRILDWYSEARIIIIIRDGRDVACSIQGRTGSLEEGVKEWMETNQIGKNYWHHSNVHVLKYEDLITDFEETITAVLNFLSEEYEEGLKNYHKQEKKWYSGVIAKPSSTRGDDNHRQHRNWQINQPLFDGRGRWKKMSKEEVTYVIDQAGDMLVEFGYIDEADLVNNAVNK
ncbi:MAG: sulfotransferase [Pseudomonadota bacterium]